MTKACKNAIGLSSLVCEIPAEVTTDLSKQSRGDFVSRSRQSVPSVVLGTRLVSLRLEQTCRGNNPSVLAVRKKKGARQAMGFVPSEACRA